MEPNTMHIALLGDSILDNRTYTNGEPDVANHLRGLLPDSVEVTLCVVDGSTSAPISRRRALSVHRQNSRPQRLSAVSNRARKYREEVQVVRGSLGIYLF